MEEISKMCSAIMCMSIISCIFVLASFGFIMVLFYKFSNLDELFEDIKKRNADRYEFVCIKENMSDRTKWFKNGNSYKNIDGKVRDEQGTAWDFSLYKVSKDLYRICGYVFERRKIDEHD